MSRPVRAIIAASVRQILRCASSGHLNVSRPSSRLACRHGKLPGYDRDFTTPFFELLDENKVSSPGKVTVGTSFDQVVWMSHFYKCFRAFASTVRSLTRSEFHNRHLTTFFFLASLFSSLYHTVNRLLILFISTYKAKSCVPSKRKVLPLLALFTPNNLIALYVFYMN